MASNPQHEEEQDSLTYACDNLVPDDQFEFVPPPDSDPALIIRLRLYVYHTHRNEVIFVVVVSDVAHPLEVVRIQGQDFELCDNCLVHASEHMLKEKPRRLLLAMALSAEWQQHGPQPEQRCMNELLEVEVGSPFVGAVRSGTICELGAGRFREMLTNHKMTIKCECVDGNERVVGQVAMSKTLVCEEQGPGASELVVSNQLSRQRSRSETNSAEPDDRVDHTDNG